METNVILRKSMTPTHTMHCKENPSFFKPYLCIKFDPPTKKWVALHDPEDVTWIPWKISCWNMKLAIEMVPFWGDISWFGGWWWPLDINHPFLFFQWKTTPLLRQLLQPLHHQILKAIVLMVQKSGEHQLRLLVHARFYTSQLVLHWGGMLKGASLRSWKTHTRTHIIPIHTNWDGDCFGKVLSNTCLFVCVTYAGISLSHVKVGSTIHLSS